MVLKKIVIAAAAVVMTAQTAFAASFTDIDNHWAKDSINVLADRGVVNGVTDTQFMPDGIVTRAQYLKMIMEATNCGTAEVRAGECLDARAEDWYAPYLQKALDSGIIPNEMIEGYSEKVDYNVDENGNALYSKVIYDGAFNGNIPITREEMAALTQFAYQYTRNVLTSKGIKAADSALFEDSDRISDWAVVSVNSAVANGFMDGMDINYFNPTSTATRAHAATVILRVMNKG